MATTVARTAALRLGLGSMLVAGAWLLLAAMPVLADGGPHVGSANSGLSTLTADGCAGCHRAHTAQGQYLLKAATAEDLCLACHGSTGTGATTNVEDGVQYALTNAGSGQPVAGALRGGGFVNARIDSAHSSRKSYPVGVGSNAWTSFSSRVAVLAAGAPVTSAHLDLDGPNGVVAHGTAWGNGAIGSGAGPVVELGCTGCHNPHGNGLYRILVPIPSPTGTGFVAAGSGASVTDAALPVGTRNYTVQWGRELSDVTAGTYVNNGTPGTPTPVAGDYWRKFLPWDVVPVPGARGIPTLPAGGHAGDVPGYVPGAPDNLTTFKVQISTWCSTCHTRYSAGGNPPTDSGDGVYRYRHQTDQTECTQCHVAHGTNAAMPGAFSGPMAYPDGSPPTSYTTGTPPTDVTTYDNSRLLKIDNRGTCQACHDPTLTIPSDGSVISH
jgi:predicted CXXCH cytochrome family protein